jgi:sigma-B regulation protein RsbU (phosphoserine phosphatase)
MTASKLEFKPIYRKLAWIDKLFLLLLLLLLVSLAFNPAGASNSFLEFLLIVTGVAVGIRLIGLGIRKAIWRLRNRLLVTYLFIAVVPVVLILVLVGVAAYALTGQVVVYLVSSELERKAAVLLGQAEWLSMAARQGRSEPLREIVGYLKERHAGLEVLVRDATDSAPGDSAGNWGQAHGVVLKDRAWYAWAHVTGGATEVTLLEPLTRRYLANLVPRLGEVTISTRTPEVEKGARESFLPAPANRFDMEVLWGDPLFPVAVWDSPGKSATSFLLIRSRPSAVLATVFGRGVTDYTQSLLMFFVAVAILFLIVELISLVIGTNLTRTITRAVHDLYGATQRVKEGDFTHSIEVHGIDQLAELSHSFNVMTGNLQRLVAVEKEKERLQAEIEIAQEVQNQLYPKSVPVMRTLRLKACCKPARMVSGDYFDYLGLDDSRVALAIGDVAGKGISAALLMATVQSSLRTQLRNAHGTPLSTSALVAQLNQQLFAYTSPEKYATFYFGLYDDSSGLLTYTNAGHLPPLILRNGEAIRLEVNGTIVGAFPSSQYDESRVELQSGDLLICYTDGITEPENEYGEMFGDERLLEAVRKNRERSEDEIVASIIDSVTEWTGEGELQDDMTLLVARRL